MELIGKKIRTLRKNKNMTQEQLAEVLSVSSQAVSKWENNISVPDIGLLPVIARYFGITMDEFFNYRLDALNYKERFIRFMADNGVLKFGEYKLQSGRISPYFINTGNYKSGAQIAKLGEFYAECIRENNVQMNVLFANTWNEIPLMIATEMILYSKYGIDISYCINREECPSKDIVIGKKLSERDEITVVKDTLTSGNTLRATLQELRNIVKTDALSVIVSVDRMEVGNHSSESARHEIEKQFGVKIFSIVTLEDIIHAMEHDVIGGIEYLDAMKLYREEYGGC